jgi:hypothetical protein
MIHTNFPSQNALAELYAGAVFKCAATDKTQALTARIRGLLAEAFGADLQTVHERFVFADMKQPLADIRAMLERDAIYTDACRDILAGLGLPHMRRDALRLRCVMHGGHESKAAERAYAAHRDTWFGNPEAQINIWIPLLDVTADQTFTFYPSYFDAPIKNSSGVFNYDNWMQTVGWQGARTVQQAAEIDYPQVLEEIVDEKAFGFSAKAGEMIIFAAAHLHQTVPNSSGRTRFSIDFRAVHMADHQAGKGAPNVDNASRPDALRDYA